MKWFCIAVGACDAATGALLVSAPTWTLRLMRITNLPGETIYLRWIGVFVGCVGLFYLYPFLTIGDVGRRVRWRVVFELTAIARIAVALFVVAAMLQGSLTWHWSSVPATDLVVASVQIVALQRGALNDDRG